MFFHGIDYKYLLYQYPVLSPRLTVLKQSESQKADRKHLIERFGFEPVHFLESSKLYPPAKCIASCFTFGDTIVTFKKLPLPILQLSAHEVGLKAAYLNDIDFIIIKQKKLVPNLKDLFPKKIIFIPNRFDFIEIIIKIKKWRRIKKTVEII